MSKLVLDALFPKVRQAVLSAVLLHPETWWYMSHLANHLNMMPSSLQRELASLVQAGILEVRKEGGRTYYRANSACPVLTDLQGLMVKTAGLADVVKSALKPAYKDIALAFIHGSIARAEALASSDVDLVIVGRLKLIDVATQLRKAEAVVDRDINPTIYTEKEFIKKIKAGDTFLQTVLRDKKIFLKGNELELEAMAG